MLSASLVPSHLSRAALIAVTGTRFARVMADAQPSFLAPWTIDDNGGPRCAAGRLAIASI